MQKKGSRQRRLHIPPRLAQSVTDILHFPLTIIEAPMGYGKTTAVREGLRNTCGDLLWHRVADASIDDVWKGFCRLISKLDDACARNLMQLGIPDDAAILREVIHLLENIDISAETVLVLDDYHLVGTAEVNRFIREITVAEIPNLHVVVIARYIDFDGMDELRLKGFVQHITKEAFEFDKKDIRQYFRLCGVSLTEEDEARLHAYTEGWISALYLVMLNYKEIGYFTLSPDIYKLVETTVYNPLSDDLKRFLLTMSLFGSFSLEQAVFITGDKNAGKSAEAVIRKNAFLEYDSQTKRYQMHPVLAGFLNDLPEAQALRPLLSAKAGEWYDAVGEYRLAMKYLFDSGDYDGLLDIIEKDQGNSFNTAHVLFSGYMENCPDEAKARHPKVLLIYIVHLQMFNQQELLIKASGEFLHILETEKLISADMRHDLLGEFEVIQSFSEFNDINRMSAHYRKAWELMQHPLTVYDTRNNWTFGSPSVLLLFYRETGKLSQHVADLYQAMPDYYRVSANHGIGGEYLMDAEMHFFMGDLENAEILMHKARLKAQPSGETGILLGAAFLEMRIVMMKGDGIRLFKLLDDMRRNMMTHNDYLYLHTIELCEGYILSLMGSNSAFQNKIPTHSLFDAKLMFPAMPMLGIVQGRVMLIRGEYLKLMGSHDSYLELAAVFPNKLAQIHAYIYNSAGSHMLFRTAEALDALRIALDMAMPDKLYMPFVENCDFILQPLKQLQQQGVWRDDISAILDICNTYRHALTQIHQAFQTEKKVALTEREREIAQLAAEGYSNRSIGANLYISENSVKTMLKSIYVKLGINSRLLLKQHMTKPD